MRSIHALSGVLVLVLARASLGASDLASQPVPRPLGADLPVYEAPPPGSPETAPAGSDPEGTIRLGDALAAALLRSPELAAFAFELRASEARTLQAVQRPNPELTLEVEDVGGSDEFRGFREAQTTLQISQPIELGGKRSARIEAAARARSLAGWDYEARRLDLFSATAHAFVDVLVAQEGVALRRAGLALAGAEGEAARERLRAGLAPEVEVTRSEVSRSSAETALAKAEHALAAARQHLAAQWGGLEARFERAEGKLEPLLPPPPLETLLARLGENPDLARFEDEASERDAALRLARAEAYPDLRLGPGVRRLEGPDETAFVLGASLPLPLFDRNRGAIAEAEVRRAKLASERRAVETRLATELRAAYHALAAAFGEAEMLRARTLPATQASLRAVRDGYRRGRFGQLEVLEAQRSHFGARADHLRALGEYHHSRAALERLTAAPLEETR